MKTQVKFAVPHKYELGQYFNGPFFLYWLFAEPTELGKAREINILFIYNKY